MLKNSKPTVNLQQKTVFALNLYEFYKV